MNLMITLLGLVVLTQALTILLAVRADRKWLLLLTSAAWLCLLPLMTLANSRWRFAGGGDDEDYFRMATKQSSSIWDIIDLAQFKSAFEQPGYPWLLTIVAQFSGQDILAFKILNLSAFIGLISVWYRIGVELDSRYFGRVMAVAILLLTPLWYYWMFALKDIIIVLLQSVFLLGLVQASQGRSVTGWLIVLAASLAIIPLRSALVLVNMSVAIGTMVLVSFRRGSMTKLLLNLCIAAVVVFAILGIASDSERMASLGVFTDNRVLSTAVFTEAVPRLFADVVKSGILFPLKYLFSDVSGFSPQTWRNIDPLWLGGVLSIPWILVGVPFLVLGFVRLFRREELVMRHRGVFAAARGSPMVMTPWGVVVMFICAYVALSWMMGDTTRWRTADMPALAAVASFGWLSVSARRRGAILLSWTIFSSWMFAAFHFL
jgi:hypothetical protein